MYKLNSESRTSRFFTWIWGKNVTDYKTMCPYFWQYVATIVFLLPILIVKFIYYLVPAKKKVMEACEYVASSQIGESFGEAVDYVYNKPSLWYKVGKVLKWVLISLFGGYLLGIVALILFMFFIYPVEAFAVVGVISTVSLIIFVLVQIQGEYNIIKKIGTPFRFIGNMISNLYHEVCPLIEWK